MRDTRLLTRLGSRQQLTQLAAEYLAPLVMKSSDSCALMNEYFTARGSVVGALSVTPRSLRTFIQARALRRRPGRQPDVVLLSALCSHVTDGDSVAKDEAGTL